MHAVIGWFESSAESKRAVKELKQAGFADEAISVRDFYPSGQGNVEQPLAPPATTVMVGVQAEGERSAEAWSILQDIKRQLADESGSPERKEPLSATLSDRFERS